MRKTIFVLLTICCLTACKTQYVSTIVGGDYDKSKNHTDYFVLPYGAVSIPGKWEKKNYNSVSRQQFFQNADSIIIAVSFGPCNKYEFNKDNSKKGFDFVTAFYEWDSEYFVNTFNLKQEKIESDSSHNYIIWRVFGDYDNTHWDTYFLFAEKNGFAKNISIMNTRKWTVDEKIDFLRKVYLNKNIE